MGLIMRCPYCGGEIYKDGYNYLAQGKVQRWKCKKCYRHTSKPKEEKINNGGK